jgi:TM2 domain-containing membrane protein YozV
MRRKYESATVALAVLLGLVTLLGAGHAYLGRWRRAIAFLLAGMGAFYGLFFAFSVLWRPIGVINPELDIQPSSGVLDYLSILGIVLYFVLFLWQCLDAWRLCKQANLRSTRAPQQ